MGIKRIVLVAFAALLVVLALVFRDGINPAPAHAFADTAAPPAPDYRNPAHWAALPSRRDSADVAPPDSGLTDRQALADADVFYLHPTSAVLLGSGWNAAVDHVFTNVVTDRGVLVQQASLFNGAGRVYAPRYRQRRMSAHTAGTAADREQSYALAYSDVQRAFAHYLQHYCAGRPLIIAAHSQGTAMARRLMLDERFAEVLRQRLVVAYLVGGRIFHDDFAARYPVCQHAQQTGCVVAWNSFVEGGDGSAKLAENAGRQRICVNPLSWRADTAAVPAAANPGSLPLVGMMGLQALDVALVGARCGDDGLLWISAPERPGYQRALFAGGDYHTYDFNLFYRSVRDNARLRARHFVAQRAATAVAGGQH